MKAELRREIVLEKGVSGYLEEGVLVVKGPKGEVRRRFVHPYIVATVEDGRVVFLARNGSKREKTMIGSFESHVQNMVKGVQQGHIYKLKICSGHFPMTVAVSGNEIVIKNFLGETVPRRAALLKGVEVKVSGTEIIVTSADKEMAGQMAARIEELCRITNRDRRIFQDGCYIVEKAGRGVV